MSLELTVDVRSGETVSSAGKSTAPTRMGKITSGCSCLRTRGSLSKPKTIRETDSVWNALDVDLSFEVDTHLAITNFDCNCHRRIALLLRRGKSTTRRTAKITENDAKSILRGFPSETLFIDYIALVIRFRKRDVLYREGTGRCIIFENDDAFGVVLVIRASKKTKPEPSEVAIFTLQLEHSLFGGVLEAQKRVLITCGLNRYPSISDCRVERATRGDDGERTDDEQSEAEVRDPSHRCIRFEVATFPVPIGS
ncbi:hypothetical protein [Natronorubrum halophilum]|uniref:hypothetical protein n=1 Tax=Natronorubrum halophilum TaxID=1702106 RepID=UPI0010C245A6|nr:hypothetical protein [Natronorubrum halophilum]